MADYAKKTVKELQELLSAKGLPTSGKKAELISRLQEAEKPAETVTTPKEAPVPSISVPASEPAPPAADSKPSTKPSPGNPATAPPAESLAPVPAPALAQDARESSATTDTKLANAVSYAMNLPTSSLDDELKKRKARAERFGTSAATNEGEGEAVTGPDADTVKALERAKRFGTSENAVGKLDEALPEEREKGGRKRGRGEEDSAHRGAYDDPGLRFGRGGKRRLNDRGRGGRVGGGSDRPQGVVKTGTAAFSSEKDRLAAEARKKKFGN